MLRKVLVVDDDSVNRRILNKILSSEYDVLEAEDGEAALEIMGDAPESISAVLLDIHMPKMDGYEVLEQMHRNALLVNIPVIVATGSTETSAEVKALSLGAHDFITKPFNPDIIKHRLWNTINLRETAAVANASRLDELTGLLNRRAFFETAQRLISEKEPGYYVMACFDIDNFKVVNDQYGTKMGDEVLKYIGNTLKRVTEDVDGICCRMGADHFALLYPRVYMESPIIESNHKDAISFNRIEQTITIKIGRYIVSDTTIPPNAMYDRAALAEASIKGKYDVHIALFDESMREHIIHEQQIVTDMSAALKSGQFEPWFQPQYNHSTGALIGAEALVRWRKTSGRLVPPNEFIPVFERNGFIYEMDKYIWEQTCKLIRKWLDEGREPVPVSVNISRVDMFREDFYDVITSLIAKHNIPVELLRLEVTESAFTESSELIISMVKRLIKFGFTVEIDDFGSGFSSLNTLKDVPASILKLDMKFLDSTNDSERGGNIIESVVRMAKWLDMSVIAEGVETSVQADYLRSIGCCYIQGYLYAKPMPLEDYEKLMDSSAYKEGRMPVLNTFDELDNNAFWDPHSMDTLVFNSFVNGACIFEYHDGSIELLRATERYTRIFSSPEMTVESALKLNWASHIDEETNNALSQALTESIQTKDSVVRECVFHDLPGCPKKTYLRMTMRVIASTDERRLVYCTNENITAQREAEYKRLESAEQLKMIIDGIGGGITASVIADGRIKLLTANDGFYELHGYTREQYLLEVDDPLALIHPSDRETVQKTSFDNYISETSAAIEYRIKRRDGTDRWLHAALSPIRLYGVDECVQLCILTDTTYQKETERELISND